MHSPNHHHDITITFLIHNPNYPHLHHHHHHHYHHEQLHHHRKKGISTNQHAQMDIRDSSDSRSVLSFRSAVPQCKLWLYNHHHQHNILINIYCKFKWKVY